MAPRQRRTHRTTRRCSVPGCTASIRRRGLCGRHGGRDKCSVEGCETIARGKLRLCFAHTPPEQKPRCKQPNCGKTPQAAGGLCHRCASRAQCSWGYLPSATALSNQLAVPIFSNVCHSFNNGSTPPPHLGVAVSGSVLVLPQDLSKLVSPASSTVDDSGLGGYGFLFSPTTTGGVLAKVEDDPLRIEDEEGKAEVKGFEPNVMETRTRLPAARDGAVEPITELSAYAIDVKEMFIPQLTSENQMPWNEQSDIPTVPLDSAMELLDLWP